MATIKQAKYKQVGTDGSVTMFHFQTDADIVIDGLVKKVPTITEINNWAAIRTEVLDARKDLDGVTHNSLDTRLESMETRLKAQNLLDHIKTVDGSGSGLDSDTVDGRNVDDTATASTTTLWTSNKVKTEVDKKLNSTEIVTVATANKILKLDSSGKLPADITGNSPTATKLSTARKIILAGSVIGETNFDGTADVTINATVRNNSHEHSSIVNTGATSIETKGSTGNVTDFKSEGVIKSSIDFGGNFTGSAAKVNGRSVDDTGKTSSHLLTAAKVYEQLGLKLNATNIKTYGSTKNSMDVQGVESQWGTVSMANVNLLTISFPNSYPQGTIPTITISDESSDYTRTCRIKPGSVTNTKFDVICDKVSTDAKIHWNAIGYNGRTIA